MSLTEFTEWLAREMPSGTVIGDPRWWAPRIAAAHIAAGQQGEPAEKCESGLPDCGPVEHWDVDSVPLCRRCWDELAAESSAAQEPSYIPFRQLAAEEIAASALATPQPPKPAGLCANCTADGRCMKRQALCVANGTADAKPAGAVDLAELRKIGTDANDAALTLGEIGLRGACIDTATRIRALLANQPVKPAVADPLSDNPQPLPANPSLSDKGAVPLPEPDIDTSNHAHIRVRGHTEAKLRAYGDAREAAAIGGLARLDIAITFDDGQEAAITVYGSARDMRRLEARMEYWRGLEAAGRADAVPLVDAAFAACDEITGLCSNLRQGGPAPEDLENLSSALESAIDIAANMLAKISEARASAPQQMTTQGEAVARNPLQAYADSYRMMARMGDGKVDCLSVAIDIENNMSKHTGPQS